MEISRSSPLASNSGPRIRLTPLPMFRPFSGITFQIFRTHSSVFQQLFSFGSYSISKKTTGDFPALFSIIIKKGSENQRWLPKCPKYLPQIPSFPKSHTSILIEDFSQSTIEPAQIIKNTSFIIKNVFNFQNFLK